MNKYRITYIHKGYRHPTIGGIETDNAITWFANNAPQKYSIISYEIVSVAEFNKLEKLDKNQEFKSDK